MATGVFGNIRPADVDVEDMEIFYTYSPNREQQGLESFRLDPTEIITQINIPVDEGNEILEGVYNINLDATIFNEVGIYTIIIKPRKIKTTITDCGVLSSLPDIKGIILDTTNPDLAPISNRLNNNGLIGYRIEYYDENGDKIRNFFKIVTSANRVEPVTENTSSEATVKYRLSEVGSLLFLTVTPSSQNSVKPNQIPFIGDPDQEISIINTFFNPITIEVELVDTDINTIRDAILGEQIKSVEDGILTMYDRNREILEQYDLFQIRDEIGNPLYEVRRLRQDIDESKDFDDIVENL
jgi:hypothetical protein